MNLLIAMVLISTLLKPVSGNDDPFIWLEEIEGEKVMAWVKEKNSVSEGILTTSPFYDEIYRKNLEILNSADRIPGPSIIGNYIYNFWQDADNVRGIWRRSPASAYISGAPEWEIILDLDKMSETDGISWVFKGAVPLHPEYKKFMVSLSKGGSDAAEIREFNVETKSFEEGGFFIPETKGGASWINENQLIVSYDLTPESQTNSGYPKKVKLWTRGELLEEAELIFEGETEDVGTFAGVIQTPTGSHTIIQRALTFYTTNYFIFENGTIIQLPIQEDAVISGILNNQIVVSLKSDWELEGANYKQGDLISLDFAELKNGIYKSSLIISPDNLSSITSTSITKSGLIVNMLSNVKSELLRARFENNKWELLEIDAPELGSISLSSSTPFSDLYFFYYQNFLTPSSLYLSNALDNSITRVRSLPNFFDGENYKVMQFESISADGTAIPYFVVSSKNIEYNGKNPTLLYAYGGFEVSMLPFYSASFGISWLEKGGVFVLANIRGGGEFGPGWHQSGLKENRQKVFDDFHSVAEDLISRKITSGKNLGIQGGSNGGLLVGVAFTQRPDLYGAVICQVPLLDMKRYNKLLAGASWMGEYGNPDIPGEWEYIKEYSPYHNLKPGVSYPEVFFTTSTRDDRVHPGHARKMVAKMEDMGYRVYYYENTEGGHAGASTNEQRAHGTALAFSYLLIKLSN